MRKHPPTKSVVSKQADCLGRFLIYFPKKKRYNCSVTGPVQCFSFNTIRFGPLIVIRNIMRLLAIDSNINFKLRVTFLGKLVGQLYFMEATYF